jgi:hypothetical protein
MTLFDSLYVILFVALFISAIVSLLWGYEKIRTKK